MSVFRVDKVVSALPGTLTPNTMYAVRVGAGFDLYFSDNTGSVAHKVNNASGGSGDVVGPASATDNSVVRFDATTGKLIQESSVKILDTGEVNLSNVSSPIIPGPNVLGIFGRKIAERMMPAFIGPSGLDSALQPILARNKIGYWNPPGNATTVPGVFGLTAATATGTATARNVATNNLFNRLKRLGYVSTATAGSLAGFRIPAAQFTTGDGAGLGGFFCVTRFGVSAFTSDMRMFVGVRNSTAAPTNVEPNTLTQSIGVGCGAADSNLSIFYGGTSAQTPISLGANFPAKTANTDVYELALFSPPSQTGVCHYQVTRLNTGDSASGTLSGGASVIPSSTTLLTPSNSYVCNNATAAAVGLDIASLYIETDY